MKRGKFGVVKRKGTKRGRARILRGKKRKTKRLKSSSF